MAKSRLMVGQEVLMVTDDDLKGQDESVVQVKVAENDQAFGRAADGGCEPESYSFK